LILVDTSVWIDHLKLGEPRLAQLLSQNAVLMHPMVIGEIACGSLKNRTQLISLLSDLPKCLPALDEEVMFFMEKHELMSHAISWVDVSLLAAAQLNGVRFWTRDKRLNAIAGALGLAHNELSPIIH
jgi:hypothetical protein